MMSSTTGFTISINSQMSGDADDQLTSSYMLEQDNLFPNFMLGMHLFFYYTLQIVWSSSKLKYLLINVLLLQMNKNLMRVMLKIVLNLKLSLHQGKESKLMAD